ncbi:MAG: hypothetical protein Q9M30_08795 [Mariprofundaceae bacterium]|nr:hypothetical protein [Mariprofundaceae bacterium]
MAISVLPVDGLINRLIQQNQRPSDRPSSGSASKPAQSDQVNISHEAKAQAGSSDIEQTQSQLENQLLQMYSPNSGSSS